MQSVYVETTIPSYYFETRRSIQVLAWREATRLWWQRIGPGFQLCSSQLVLDELSLVPKEKSQQGIELMQAAKLLEQVVDIESIAAYYIKHKLVPTYAIADAAHLAIASYYSMDFLLTWNCQQLANVNKARHVAVLNKRLGLAAPLITTPHYTSACLGTASRVTCLPIRLFATFGGGEPVLRVGLAGVCVDCFGWIAMRGAVLVNRRKRLGKVVPARLGAVREEAPETASPSDMALGIRFCMGMVAPKFSSVAGPAKWLAVGVVGTAGVGASIWAYSSRSQPEGTRVASSERQSVLQPEKIVSTAAVGSEKTLSAREVAAPAGDKAVESALVARGVAQQAQTESANDAADCSDAASRPFVVHRSRIGPSVFEGLNVPANAMAGSSVGNGSLGIFPSAIDVMPKGAPLSDSARDGAGPTIEVGGADKAKGAGDVKAPAKIGRLIDVNAATEAELDLLPDVGPALAKRIIEYRTKHGPFANLAAMDKVSGIGPKTLEKLKDRVTFGKGK